MMRFNKNTGLLLFRFSSGGDPAYRINGLKYQKGNDTRDKIHVAEVGDEQKLYMYEQIRGRRSTSLYNIFRHLPSPVVNLMTTMTSDPKVIIQSDDLYLPKLSPDGVPVYDSKRAAQFVMSYRNFQFLVPFFFLGVSHHYALSFAAFSLAYLLLYRPTFSALARGLVIKMQLLPSTEQLLVQRVGPFGCIQTTRYAISDLEHIDRNRLDHLLYTMSRPIIDRNMLFRSKSTGDHLYFDAYAYWYEEGLNHELLV